MKNKKYRPTGKRNGITFNTHFILFFYLELKGQDPRILLHDLMRLVRGLLSQEDRNLPLKVGITYLYQDYR